MTTLEEMGYDVKKLWQKFDEMRTIAVDEVGNRKYKEELKEKKKCLDVKADISRERLEKLRKEMMMLEAMLHSQDEQSEEIQSKVRKCTLKEKENLVSFKTAAAKPW